MKEKTNFLERQTKKTINTNVLIITTSIVLLVPIAIPLALAQDTQLDLTAPEGPTPYGGEQKGSLTISAQGNDLNLHAFIDTAAPQDKVYEGWLEDTGGSNYKLSLGQFDDNVLNFTQSMVNPYTYSQFVITEEPKDDADPLGSDVAAGAKLETPFGQ